ARLAEGNGEIFDRRRKSGDFHVDAREILIGAGIVGAPFAGGFADDQGPLVLVGNGEDGVSAGGDRLAANNDVAGGDECGSFICTGAPDLAIRNEFTINLAALGARAGVVHGNGFSASKVNRGLRWWAGALRFVLLGLRACGKQGKAKKQRDERDRYLAH